MLLAMAPLRGITYTCSENILSEAAKETCLFTVFFKSYSLPALPSMLSFFFLDILLGRHVRNDHFRVYVFCLTNQVSSVFHIAFIPLLGLLVLLRPFPLPPLPGSVLLLPSLSSGPLHDATISLGRWVLRLWPLVTFWHHPRSIVFHSTSIITSQVPGVFLASSLLPDIFPIPAPRPSVPATVSSFPSLDSTSSMDATSLKTGTGSCARICCLSVNATSCLQRLYGVRSDST